jgi:uncharacterized membrane protein YadS
MKQRVRELPFFFTSDSQDVRQTEKSIGFPCFVVVAFHVVFTESAALIRKEVVNHDEVLSVCNVYCAYIR